MNYRTARWTTSLVFLGMLIPCATAQVSNAELKLTSGKAIAYLRKQQNKDGSFSAKRFGPGPTALVIAACLRNGVPPDDPMIQKALSYLTSKVQANGGIYEKRLANYTTCVGIMALTEANREGKFDALIKNASDFLKRLQKTDVASSAIGYGGVGYDGSSRPDLSNTQFYVDSLIAAGVPRNDPAIQRAVRFVQRCQNFSDKEKGNDLAFAAKARPDDKGGFTYTPMDPDDSPHATGDGGLRSLGAMTYAGLKSYLYAGVSRDDPRVRGALRWIRADYTLDENPGMKQSGLYYYYHTFAKTMKVLGEDEFEDAKGIKHNWRLDLFQALKKRQRADGSFVNAGDRTFGEGDANLATAFALLSLSYVKQNEK